MSFLASLKLALSTLATHKFRSLLTTLGMIFGVTSVVSMMAIGKGGREQTLSKIRESGIQNIYLRANEDAAKNENPNAVLTFGLTQADHQHFTTHLENLDEIFYARNLRQPLYHKGEKTDIKTFAVSDRFAHVSGAALDKGRFFNKVDEQKHNRVCLVGMKAKRKLFGFSNPMGKPILVGTDWYKVIGILKSPSGRPFLDENLENMVVVPYQTVFAMRGTLTSDGKDGGRLVKVDYDHMVIKVKDEKAIQSTAKRIEQYLQATHPQKDYDMFLPIDLLRQAAAQARIFDIIMLSIASISLLVGGIGIMNIMLANVYERMKEIGTRRALGAKQSDILTQFLMESTVLSNVGGLLGIALGIAVAKAVDVYAGDNFPTIITSQSLLLSFGISTTVGILFGTYPAYQASKLDPIEALRTE